MKAAVTLSLLTTLVAGSAFASCEAPNYSIKVPSGATATKDEMLATQHSIKDYDAAMKVYAACLREDEDKEIAAAGDKATEDQKQKIHNKYADMTNVQVSKLEALAASFNVEIKAWKAKNAPPPAN
jgi:hypothetical protein